MAEGRIVFRGANLLDGEHALRSGVSVVVEGKRITSVSDAPPDPVDGDIQVDCTGKTLMPGMVQGHFHAGFGAFGGAIAAPVLGLEAPPTYMGALGAKNMNTALNCGFTMTIGSSNGDGLDVSLREAILHGLVDGPRVVACTREFVTSGDEADGKGGRRRGSAESYSDDEDGGGGDDNDSIDDNNNRQQ